MACGATLSVALLVVLAPQPSAPAASSLNPTPELNDTDQQAMISVLNDIVFSQPYGRQDVHDVVSVGRVLQMLRQVSEELALVKESQTKMQQNQAILQENLAMLQQSQATFLQNLATLQKNQFSLQEKQTTFEHSQTASEEACKKNVTALQDMSVTLEQKLLLWQEEQTILREELILLQKNLTKFQQTQASVEASTTTDLTVLQEKTFRLEQKQNISEEEQSGMQQTQTFIGETVAILRHNQTIYLQMQRTLEEQIALHQQSHSNLSTNLVSIQDTLAGMEITLAKLQKDQGMGFFVHDGQMFHVHTASKLNWDAAQLWCQNNWSGDLAVPTGDLNHFINEVAVRIKKSSKETYIPLWLGVNDREQDGQWLTVDGTVMNDQIPWGDDQPNNHGGVQECLEINIHSDGTGGHANDDRCSGKANFVCGRTV